MGVFDFLRGSRPGIQNSSAPQMSRVGAQAPAFAVLDVETTGLSPKRDRILELAIVRVDIDGNPVDEWSTRMHPERPIGATHIHGIRDEDVAGAPLFRDLAPTIAAGLAGLPIVAHNARFDMAFLSSEFASAGWDLPRLASYCTLDASHHHLPHLDRRRLVDCCAATGISIQGAHSALGDARATAMLLRSYIARYRAADGVLAAAQNEARLARWPQGPVRPVARPVKRVRPPATKSAPVRYTSPRPKEPALRHQINALSLVEVFDEGAPEGTDAYLELLLSALEDGEINAQEAQSLSEARESYGFSDGDVLSAHEAFVLALAHRAVDDGRISNVERAELAALSALLEVPASTLKAVMVKAEDARRARLGAHLGELPEDWPHGEPLRVGDRVAFTGCDDAQRDRLEKRAEELGVRVMGNVSKFTVLLVADGSFSGGKHAKAQELSTRVVHPDLFEVLLRYVQPAKTAEVPARPAKPSPVVPPAGSANDAPIDPALVRAWAATQGIEVGVRGRISSEILTAYTNRPV